MEWNSTVMGHKLPENEATSLLLGLILDKNRDFVGPNWHLNLTDKIKGIPEGENWTPQNTTLKKL